jgi:hypothetical protein
LLQLKSAETELLWIAAAAETLCFLHRAPEEAGTRLVEKPIALITCAP